MILLKPEQNLYLNNARGTPLKHVEPNGYSAKHSPMGFCQDLQLPCTICTVRLDHHSRKYPERPRGGIKTSLLLIRVPPLQWIVKIACQ